MNAEQRIERLEAEVRDLRELLYRWQDALYQESSVRSSEFRRVDARLMAQLDASIELWERTR